VKLASKSKGDEKWTQGGILIYDKYGNLRCAFNETYGGPLDLDEIKAAIRLISKEQRADEKAEEKAAETLNSSITTAALNASLVLSG
jgi:hypothetical protein